MSFLQQIARKTADKLGRRSWLGRQLRPKYESYLSWASGDRGIHWDINGVTYRIDPFYRDQMGQRYDPEIADFLRNRIKVNDLCLDVGANVGIYVLQLAHWTQPAGRIVAFEPNPSTRQVLQKHIRMNDLCERVEVVAAAVGAKVGRASFYAAAEDGMSRMGAANRLIADRVVEIEVPVVTLDSYCQENALEPDWMLIDIEGFEIAALTGAIELIKSRGRNLNIVVEMHPAAWPVADTTREQVESLLDELGLHAIPLTGQADPLADYGQVYLSRG